MLTEVEEAVEIVIVRGGRLHCVRISAWVFGPEIRIFQRRANRTTVSAAYRALPLAMTKLLPALRVAVLSA